MKEKKNHVPQTTGGLLAAVSAAAAVAGGCQWLFQYAVARKQWPLPSFIEKLIQGNGEPDAYEILVQEAEEKLLEQPFEQAELFSKDGLRLKARFYPGEEGNKEVFLAVHGCRSRGTKEFCFLHSYYRKQGSSFLLIDLRACGASEGDYMTYGVKESEDVRLWIDWLLKRCGNDVHIFLHGISMGAATVLIAAGKPLPSQIKGVIADCSYTSAWDEFAYQLENSFHLPARFILALINQICRKKAGFDMHEASPQNAAGKSGIPHLYIHGEADAFVPYFMMKQLYNACQAPKIKCSIPKAVHARGYYTDTEAYETAVDRFVNGLVLQEAK